MVIFDTGAIIAAAFTTEEHYHSCAELFTGLRLARRRLLLPATVTAEVGYLMDKLGGPRREAGFLAGVSDDIAFGVANLDRDRVGVTVLAADLDRTAGPVALGPHTDDTPGLAGSSRFPLRRHPLGPPNRRGH